MSTRAGNPYIGPRTFQEHEQDRFFGRDREAAELHALVVSEQLVLFYAQSGAGKSSLLRTRLIPDLRAKGFDILLGRLGDDTQSSTVAENIFAFNLMRSLVRNEADADALEDISLRRFFAKFRQEALRSTLTFQSRSSSGRRVLIIDQFEELFSLHPAAWEKREDLFRQLAEVMENDSHLKIVLVIREDYLASLDPYAHLLPGRLRMRYHMQQMEHGAALKAIKEPVQLPEYFRPYAPGVAEKLVDDLRRTKVMKPDGTLDFQPGQFVEPLQLQVICYNLWENLPPGGTQITDRDLLEVGDVNASLGGHYATRVRAVAAAEGVSEARIRRWFNDQLISPNGVRNMVLRDPDGTTEGLENDVIQALSDLVRAEQRGGATFYELTHDRLVEPILQDNKNWFEQNLSPLQRQAALWKDQGENESWLLSGQALEEVEHWASSHLEDLTETEREFLKASQARRSTLEREQRARRLNRIIALLGLVMVILAVFTYQTYQNGRRQVRAALAGQLSILSNAALDRFPQTSLLLAVEANSVVRPDEHRVAAAEAALRETLKDPHGVPLFKHDGAVTTLAVSFDGRWLATGGDDLVVRLWDLRKRPGDGNPVELEGPTEKISKVGFSQDGRWLASASHDDTVWLWDLTLPDPASNAKSLVGHGGDIDSLAFSPDGRWLATGSEDETAKLWDLAASHPNQGVKTLTGQGSWITTLAFSPDGRWLATGGGGATVLIWELQDPDLAGTESLPLPCHTRGVGTLAFSPDGRWLATGSQDQTVCIWDMSALGAQNDQAEFVLKGNSDIVTTLAFSPDGHWLAAGSADYTTRLWEITADGPTADSSELVGHLGAIQALAFDADSRWLATGSQDHAVRLWDLSSANPAVNPRILNGHDGAVNALVFSPDGHWLVSGGGDGSVRLWDQVEADPAVNPLVMTGHERKVYSLAISPDGRWLATGSEDGTARLWDLTNPSSDPIVLARHTSWIEILAFSPESRWLATGGGDGDVFLWDVQADDPSTTPIELAGHARRILALAFSPDGHWLATGSGDWSARLWDLTASDPGAAFIPLEGHSGDLNALAFSPDGRWLATGSADNTVRLWGIQSADPATNFRELKGHADDILAVAFSPDGRWLATGSGDRFARLWDMSLTDPAADSKLLPGHDGDVRTLAFSPDGRWLATGSFDGTTRLWNMRDADPSTAPRLLTGHADWVNALAFSPDSRWLATGSRDRTAHLWDLDILDSSQAQYLVVLSAHTGFINALAFSPDSRWLATGSEDKTVRLWLVQADELKSLACTITGRNFSTNEWQRYFPGALYHRTCEQWSQGR